MEKKEFKFELKELKETGEFEGYAAVFGNLDKGGDIIMEGAFTKTLLEKKEFPISWMHDIRDLLGAAKAEQDNFGLKVSGALNMAVQSAKEKYALMKQGVIKALSIGYDTVKAIFENNGAIRKLTEVKLYEIALVPWPMNSEAQIMNVKMEGKPYPNEHACRLQDPDKYDRFTRGERKHKGKAYSVIFGWRKKDEEEVSEEQAYRYDKKTWAADEARAHCKDHDGKFEAASGKAFNEMLGEIISWKDACCTYFDGEQKKLIGDAVASLEALSQSEPPQGTPGKEPPDIKSDPVTDQLLGKLLDEIESFHKILGGKTS